MGDQTGSDMFIQDLLEDIELDYDTDYTDRGEVPFAEVPKHITTLPDEPLHDHIYWLQRHR